MLRMVRILAEEGVNKVRITGGEPFVRRGMMEFLEDLTNVPGIEQVNITTNGVLTSALVPDLKRIGIHSINLSLDSLNRERFHEMTRRDELPRVLETLHGLLEHGIKTKINTVVMAGKNDDDIISLLTPKINSRWFWEMPFNGEGLKLENFLSYQKIMEKIREKYPDIQRLADAPTSTSYNYQIPGFAGTVGVIAAYSRTFCGTCNRIRVTPTGTFKTCLYDDGVMNVRDLLRSGISDEAFKNEIVNSLQHRAKDGFEAEANRSSEVTESMTTIGG
jgi:cyclic pyranopterin phosphate synthase